MSKKKGFIEELFSTHSDCLMALFFSFGALLGIVINIIVAMSVWGYLRAMFQYVLYGYIAGFIVMVVCAPLALISYRRIIAHIKNGEGTPLRTLSTVLSLFMLFLSIALLVLSMFL